jgi:hypothetical protein
MLAASVGDWMMKKTTKTTASTLTTFLVSMSSLLRGDLGDPRGPPRCYGRCERFQLAAPVRSFRAHFGCGASVHLDAIAGYGRPRPPESALM